MMKYLLLIVSVLLATVSCTDSQFLDESVGNPTELSSTNELNTLIEKARWGDGQAFVKLADCYRDGKGVNKDFIGMLAMLSQADEYGGISNMADRLIHGFVTDMISCGNFAVFNVADIFITCGCFLMMAAVLFMYKNGEEL